jgi:hypothetical protein
MFTLITLEEGESGQFKQQLEGLINFYSQSNIEGGET